MTFSRTRNGAPPPEQRRPRRLGAKAATMVFFVALACAHTWPLASAPGTWCRNDTGDPVLNEWTLAWVAHQVVADPLHLFDANIFHPRRWTLAYSEHMLPQALMVAPVAWAGGSPVLAHNLALLAGLALTAWAFCHLIWRWTGSLAAGLVAGSAAAFNAHSLTRLAHLQAQHLEFLPLALLALDKLVAFPTVRAAVTLGASFAVQGLASGYFLVFSTVALSVGFVVRLVDRSVARWRALVPHVLLAAGVAAVILVPFLVPYWICRRDVGLVRSLEEMSRFSARLGDYLATGGILHWSTWSARYFRGDALFPGFAVMMLGGLALWRGLARTDRRVRMLLAIAAVAVACSFGVRFPPYVWLARAVPLFQGIRAPVRFGQIALVALGALAGFGAAAWLARLSRPRARVALGALLVLLVNVEAWRGPLQFSTFHGVPRIYRALAGGASGAVVYFPLHPVQTIAENTRYMLGSTLNWRPMLNGYSGFTPPDYQQHLDALEGFPDDAGLDYLRRLGVTYVAVVRQQTTADLLYRIRECPQITMLATDGHLDVYVLGHTNAASRAANPPSPGRRPPLELER